MKPLLLNILLILAITLEAALISDDFPSTPQTALEIGFTSDINGTIEAETDEDWFKFTLQQDDGIIITAFNSGSVIWLDEQVRQVYYLHKATDFAYIDTYGNYYDVYDPDELIDWYPFPSMIIDDNGNAYVDAIIGTPLNLTKGTYYIQIKNTKGAIDDYSFNVRINGEVEPEVSLNASTMKYCQEHPVECGITNDGFMYTEADINKSISDTKVLCAEDPIACGIQEVKAVTAEDINTLESGWHLVGTSQAITDLGVFDTAKVVWAWNNGWKLYSPVQSIQETIASSLSYTSLDQIDAQKGFWVLKE